MNFFANLRIRTKLALGFSVVVLLLIGTALIGLSRLASLDTHVRNLADDKIVKALDVAHYKDVSNKSAIEFRDAIISNDVATVKASRAAIATHKGEMTALIAKIESMIHTERGRELMAKVGQTRKVYADQRTKIYTLLEAGQWDEARKAMVTSLDPSHVAYFAALNALGEYQVKLVDEEANVAAAEYRSGVVVIVSLALIAVLAALIVAFLVARSITRPIGRAVDAVDALAKGDFTHAMQAGGKDEIGQLLTSMKTAFGTLSTLIGGVKTSAETIGNAAREIALGNTDLSQRTEEQAASLEETAASMEELTGTVRQNADNAKQASQLATNAADVALQGSNTVQGVVTTMEGISAASNKISDIISVIEGIAFQTNILALNAAVEAARAGEQGRGFAVVASEVRSLAQRSATAAKEIKELITASVERVQAGTDQVAVAGKTMTEVLASIKRVNDIMGEIASASSEQSTGIGQVAKAVQQMDEVTQQNAALVEQASAAAHSLEEQSQGLRAAVAVFHTHDTSGSSAQAPAARPTPAPAARPAAPAPAPVETRPAREPLRRPATGGGGFPQTAVAAAAGDWESF